MKHLFNVFWKVKTLSILMLMILHTYFINGQNDPMLSQQGLNRFIFNPAAAGTSNYFHTSFISRNQWTGFPGSPITNIFNAHNFIPALKVGIGLIAMQDKIGLESNFNIKTAYSYHVWLDEDNMLSFGVSAGIYSKNFALEKIILENPSDINVNNLENTVKPDFDFGVEFNRQELTAGFSITHLLNSHKNATNIKYPRHVYLYASYIYPVLENIDLKSIASVSNTSNLFSCELAVIGELKNKFWIGVMNRFNESAVLMGGYYITPKIRVGYSYDINYKPLKRYHGGSHEVFLHIMVEKKLIESKTPRFFH